MFFLNSLGNPQSVATELLPRQYGRPNSFSDLGMAHVFRGLGFDILHLAVEHHLVGLEGAAGHTLEPAAVAHVVVLLPRSPRRRRQRLARIVERGAARAVAHRLRFARMLADVYLETAALKRKILSCSHCQELGQLAT